MHRGSSLVPKTLPVFNVTGRHAWPGDKATEDLAQTSHKLAWLAFRFIIAL